MNATNPPGEALKREALANHEANRERLILRARRRLLLHLLDHGSGSIDDARRGLELEGANPVALGAVPGALARARIIRPIGFAKSTRTLAHARPVTIWTLDNPQAARAWLAAHPEPLPRTAPVQSELPLSNEPGSGNVPVQ